MRDARCHGADQVFNTHSYVVKIYMASRIFLLVDDLAIDGFTPAASPLRCFIRRHDPDVVSGDEIRVVLISGETPTVPFSDDAVPCHEGSQNVAIRELLK